MFPFCLKVASECDDLFISCCASSFLCSATLVRSHDVIEAHMATLVHENIAPFMAHASR